MSKVYKYDVFISYAPKDKDDAQRLTSLLIGYGLTAWFDVWNLVVGVPRKEEVIKAMQQSRVIILVFGTPDSSDKIAGDDEYELALNVAKEDKDVKLLPVLLPGSDPNSLPPSIKSIAALDLTDLETSMVPIAEMIRAYFPEKFELKILSEQAEALLREQKNEEGIAIYTTIVQRDPTYWLGWLAIGLVSYNKMDLEKALQCFYKVLEINSAVSLAYASIADMKFLFLNDPEGAIDYYKRALESYHKFSADDNNAYVATIKGNLGNLYLRNGKPDFALDYLKVAEQTLSGLALEQTNLIGQVDNSLGEYYALVNDYSQSKIYFEKARINYEQFFGADNEYSKKIAEKIKTLGAEPVKK